MYTMSLEPRALFTDACDACFVCDCELFQFLSWVLLTAVFGGSKMRMYEVGDFVTTRADNAMLLVPLQVGLTPSLSIKPTINKHTHRLCISTSGSSSICQVTAFFSWKAHVCVCMYVCVRPCLCTHRYKMIRKWEALSSSKDVYTQNKGRIAVLFHSCEHLVQLCNGEFELMKHMGDGALT